MATTRIRPVTLLAAAFALAPLAGAYAATYYASPTGTPDAACTESDPGTIQAAVDKAVPGSAWTNCDEVLLLPGTYDFSGTAWSGKNAVEIKSRSYLTILFHANLPYDIGGGTHKNALYGTTTGLPAFTDSIQTGDPRYNAGLDPRAPWFAPRSGSPARDAGMERGYTESSLDLAGRLRLNGPVDIGCYEYWPGNFGTIFGVR